MPDIIVDTSALVAFFVRSEIDHAAAREYAAQNQTARWIILESVFGEFVTWVRAKISISDSIMVGQVLRREHIYMSISDDDDAATWECFCQYSDKLWSYTDCSVLAMAQKLGISEVFAFDRHMDQMAGLGIRRVP